MAKVCKFPVSASKMAEGAGMKAKVLHDGRIKVTDPKSGALLGTFINETEAKKAISGFVGQNARDLDGQLPFPALGTPLSQTPLPLQSQLVAKAEQVSDFIRKGVTVAQTGPLARITPIGKLANAAEVQGFGPAKSKVFDPTQNARNTYEAALTATRPKLGSIFKGKDSSLQATAKQIQKEQLKPEIGGKEQRELITRWNEARTKNELIEPGALLEGGMDEANIAMADQFSALGVADEMWEMMRMNAVIDDLLANRETAVDFIPKLRAAGEVDSAFIDSIEAAVGTGKNTPEALIQALGMTADEQSGMMLLREIIDQQEMNIPAIWRYATAPKLESGFKNGAEQYASKMGMNRASVSLAKKRRDYLIETFDGDAALQDQVLGAQLPAFREAMKVGFMPGKQFADGASPAMKRWLTPLQHLVVGNEILNRRVLSGLLNPNELDPAVSALKHARNMLYRKHMDQPMKEAMGFATGIAKNGDERIGKFMINYLHELEGLPTASFKALNSMIISVAKSFNIGVRDGVAERLISTLNFTTYASAIPFRASLIARNSFQTMLNIPIMGGEAWYRGVKTTLGYGPDGVARPEAAQAAYEYAIKVGALKPNVTPLHGGTDLIGSVSEGMFGGLPSSLQRAGLTTKEVFETGFTWYTKPDDVGRVISLFTGKSRVNKALSNYHRLPGPDAIIQTGKNKGRTAIEVLKREGKVKTFDEVIEAEFESLIRQDRWLDAEDLIGVSLANKVHFLYGAANHPPGWGSVPGRLLGQFGTFPIQYLSHVTESLTRGTAKDRAEFLAAHSAINLGIVSAGANLFGADLESWAFLPSLTYTGGPYADVLLNSLSALGGSDAERSLALRSLKLRLPSWNNPSIFIPGSHFVFDVVRGAEEDDFLRGIARMTGVKFLDGREPAFNDAVANVRAGFGWINEIP